MRAAIAGFAFGITWLQYQSSLPSYMVLAMMFAGMLLAWWLSRWRALSKFSIPLRIVCGVLLGAIWAALFALQALKHELPTELEGRDLVLIGIVDNLPNRFERGARFNFAVEQAMLDGHEIPGVPPKIALSWQDGYGEGAALAVPMLRPGERWQLTVRLKRPHGNANPYGFDYEVWLLEQGLRATGYVRPDERQHYRNRRMDSFVFGLGWSVERVRGWLRDRMLAALPDQPYAGVLVALVIGDQRAIKQSDWTVFNRTGVGHLISISGLHITMIAGMAAWLVSALWRRSFFTSAQLPLWLPAQKLAALAGAGTALVYVLLAGFGVPAQRTLYMLSVVALALWSGRIANVSQILFAALGVVLLLDPWAVLWPGFWLSFGAVGVILYASVGRTAPARLPQASYWQRWLPTLKSATRTQYAVTLGLVPLTMLLFGQVSLISPLANALAIPFVSLLVTPLALLGSVAPFPLDGWILGLAHACMTALAGVLAWMSDIPFAVWTAPIPPLWIFAFALAGTLWLLAPRGWPLRCIGAVGWLPLILQGPSAPAAGEMWVTAFDVGQGSAVLIETQRHRLLYDTGPAYSPESDGGNRVILPYLKGRGINVLDMMMVTHDDTDHSGGAISVMKEVAVTEVSSSLRDGHPIAATAPSYTRCEAGQRWEWDGVQFEVFHPPAVVYDSTKWKTNDRSCVLKVSAAVMRFC